MKFSGLLLRESLKDASAVLTLVKIVKEETWADVKNAVSWQPKTWNAIYFEFEGDETQAHVVADLITRQLKDKWYANFSSSDTVYVMYPSKKPYIYKKGDKEKKQEAKNYGLMIGVPESQLDWAE